jgi:hypothetical protein
LHSGLEGFAGLRVGFLAEAEGPYLALDLHGAFSLVQLLQKLEGTLHNLLVVVVDVRQVVVVVLFEEAARRLLATAHLHAIQGTSIRNCRYSHLMSSFERF